MNATEALLCRLLRDGGQSMSEVSPPSDVEHFIRMARLHGVLPMLDQCFDSLPNRSEWPGTILAACHDAAVSETVHEVLRRRELVRMLEAFAATGVKPLLLKGAALAYSHYPRAALRPRADTDVIIPEASLAAATETLLALGYSHNLGLSGKLIISQTSWSYRDHHGLSHDVDLHWKVSNAQILADVLEFEELEEQAIPIASLCPHAFGLAPVHALLLACIHRAAHKGDSHFSDDADHPGGDRLIWLYDIHLLLSQMSAPDLGKFAEVAAERRVKAVCLEALTCTVRCFGTAISVLVLDQLGCAGQKEPSKRLLRGEPALRMIAELVALDSLGRRLQWVRELVFPRAEYMRAKYPSVIFDWLPWLYFRRAVRGLWKLVIPRRHDRAP